MLSAMEDDDSMHSAAEVSRLQQELELLRLKDLQQEHHIHVLTQQLRSIQAGPSQQPAASQPALQSSVSAKWREWRQRRSQSPDRFQRPASQKLHMQTDRTGRAAQPALRGLRGPVKANHDSRPDSSSQHTQSWMPKSGRHATSSLSPGRQQPHIQMGAVMGASGRLGRSPGTFGSEHRWYQPTQADYQAAALSQEALAAAAAEQELDHANWLLKSAPRSAQRCTFGSELRWWERANQLKQPVSAWPSSEQAALPAGEFSRQASPEHRGQYIGWDSPVRGQHLPRQGSTFGTEPRGLDPGAPRPALKPQPSGVAAATAAAKTCDAGSGQAVIAVPGPRSVSVDRGMRREQSSASPERAWWAPDPAPSPDSALQRIQQKHAQIQSLAAVISQRPTSARTHTVKSTFGSEARWWENPVAERALSPSSQHSASARCSPERARNLQHPPHQVSTPDQSSAKKTHSTFGSEKQWWEAQRPSTAAATSPQVQQPEAVPATAAPSAVAALWSPARRRSASPDLVKCSAGNQWQNGHEHASLQGSLPHSHSESGTKLSPTGSVATAVAPPPPPSHPQSISSTTKQQRFDQLHAQPWTRPVCVQSESQAGAQSTAGSHTGSRRESARQSADSTSPAMSGRSMRSRSISPTASLQHSRRFSRSLSNKSELQDALRHRSAERQRLEHIRSPQASEWAHTLRDLSSELRPSFQRRDSRKEALELQQEFLQQAQDSLEAFQESSSAASMLRLSQTSVPHSQGSLEDAAIEGGIYLQPMENGEWAVGAAQDRPMTTLEKRLSRSMRQGSGASGQGQAGQGTAARLSHQNSTGKAAFQRQQQQMAAQQAQAKLASFQEGAERHSAAAAKRRQQQAAADAAQPRVRMTAPHVSIQPMMQPNTHAAADLAITTPAKLTAHSSLPSTYTPSDAHRAPSQANLFRSVSWADHSQLQEPPHDDSFELSHSPKVTQTSIMQSHTALVQPVALLYSPPQDHATAKPDMMNEYGVLSGGGFPSRTAALDAYYQAKQSLETSLPSEQPLNASPTPEHVAPSRLSVAHRAATIAALEAKSDASHAPVPHAAGGSPISAASHEIILGSPARRVSLVVPNTAARTQTKADALSPGQPGLKSQLSKMMEEVAQARSEVLGLQSQLSVHSRLGQRRGSSVASVADTDVGVDDN